MGAPRTTREPDRRAEADVPPLCPDFVIGLRSPSDALAMLEAKMHEYLENGARLGWLIDTEGRRVRVYEPGKEASPSENPDEVSGGTVLPGFVLDSRPIWVPGF